MLISLSLVLSYFVILRVWLLVIYVSSCWHAVDLSLLTSNLQPTILPFGRHLAVTWQISPAMVPCCIRAAANSAHATVIHPPISDGVDHVCCFYMRSRKQCGESRAARHLPASSSKRKFVVQPQLRRSLLKSSCGSYLHLRDTRFRNSWRGNTWQGDSWSPERTR